MMNVIHGGGSSSPDSDSAFALLKVISDPAAYTQKLADLLAKIEEAREAEKKAAAAMSSASQAEGLLADQRAVFEVEVKEFRRASNLTDTALKGREAEVALRETMAAKREKALEREIAAAAAAHEDRRATLDHREAKLVADRLDLGARDTRLRELTAAAEADRESAASLKASWEAKLKSVTDTLAQLARP